MKLDFKEWLTIVALSLMIATLVAITWSTKRQIAGKIKFNSVCLSMEK